MSNVMKQTNSFLEAYGISYSGTLRKIKKSDNKMRPIFEAFTNSLEAIKIKNSTLRGCIVIKLIIIRDLYDNIDDIELEIQDNGIGFNEQEFKRLENLNDDGKGFLNKGTGRIQLIHFFKYCEYKSIYKNLSSETGYSERCFKLSKSKEYLANNTIIFFKYFNDVEANDSQTVLQLKSILNDSDKEFYSKLKLTDLKEMMIQHYLAYFCENKGLLPSIKLEHYVNDDIICKMEITDSDIPNIDSQSSFKIDYYVIPKYLSDMHVSDKQETFQIKAFKINKNQLKANNIFLTSKNEIANCIDFPFMLEGDSINDNRYLFLISSTYFDSKETDVRGKIILKTKESFAKSISYNSEIEEKEEILLDSLQEKVYSFIIDNYPEIQEKSRIKSKQVDRLQELFLLNKKTIESLKFKINDTDDMILKKIYKADAEISATKDAELYKQYQELDELDPSTEEYQEQIKNKVSQLVKSIPIQNRTSLTQYVARRKIVLEVFDKILNYEIEKLKNSKRIDENLLHNLIFKQSSSQPDESDLWLINEDFIYFTGFSEKRLRDIRIDNQKLFSRKFTEEEDRYLHSLSEDRLSKRPDILLFPKEGKCIIIEFKAPDVNVSEHLTQIDFYASLIRNYTNKDFKILTFFGFLIGESIEDRDVRGRVTRFEQSYYFDYWFRPSEKVVDFSNKMDGSIYTEIIKYSTLLSRAKLRNKIFINKLNG